jgi:hypothetical protein
MSDNVIEVHNLTKRYGQTTVVKGISFSVRTQPLGQEARSECMDGMLLGIRLGFTTACPRTFLEQLATILLPNSVARGRIRRDEMIPMRRIVPIIQYFVIQAGTEQYEGKRISSAVLSPSLAPANASSRALLPKATDSKGMKSLFLASASTGSIQPWVKPIRR